MNYDVLILGAGMAGLAAANRLVAQGYRVAIVEARERVGGRIVTHHAPSPTGGPVIPVELGAEFIHGLPVESWRLVREAQLETYELDGSNMRFAGGTLRAESGLSGAFTTLGQMADWLRRQPAGTDETVEQYLASSGLDAATQADTISYVEGFNAADHRRIGVASLVHQQTAEDAIEADRIFHLRAGYDALPGYVSRQVQAAGATLLLDRRVRRIIWRAGHVCLSGVDAQGSEFEVRGTRAVITLPLGVLQAGSVAFDPPPSHVLAGARRMAMGSVIRVPLIFRTRFWPDALSFVFSPTEFPATWWTAHPNEAPMLVGWVGGPRTAIDRDTLLERCMSTLARILNLPQAVIAEQLVSWHFHDWDADEFALGAYSFAPAGALDASSVMAEPVQGTLFFAGEHTTVSGHWGTVHGAIQSGESAATKLAADSRPA